MTFAKDSKKINQSNNYRQITVAKIVIKHLFNILIKNLFCKTKESIKTSLSVCPLIYTFLGSTKVQKYHIVTKNKYYLYATKYNLYVTKYKLYASKYKYFLFCLIISKLQASFFLSLQVSLR